MRLGIFTDSHYSTEAVTCERRYNSQSLRKIREAYKFFQAEGCHMVICLGDLIDRESDHEQEIENLREVAAIFDAFPMKTVVVMGNHDAFAFEEDEFYSILGEQCRPQDICVEQSNLVFLDACYFRSGVHYRPGDHDWTDTCYPWVEKLEKKMESLDGEVHVFLHQNVDPGIPQNHCLFNAEVLRKLFEKQGSVKTVCQGHFHPGKDSMHGGIHYITYPAMCENEGAYFILCIEREK